MGFLTVAGIPLDVQTTGAMQREPTRIGASTRAFSGALRSSVRAEKREWAFTLAPLPVASANALRSAVANGALVACSGDALGATITCEVTVTSDEPVPDGAQAVGFQRILTLRLLEV